MPPAGGRRPSTLRLPLAVRRAILAHARRERPRECCGLLIGRGREVVAAVPSRNLADSPSRFEIDPKLHIDTRRLLRQMAPSLEIAGVYHSHPQGPARPSPSDIAEAAYDEWAHLIVGLHGRRATLAAYRIRKGRVTRLALRR